MADAAIEAIRALGRAINNNFKVLPKFSLYSLIEPENGQTLEVAFRGGSDVLCLNIDKKRLKNVDGSTAADQTLPFFEPSESGLLKKNDAIFLCSRDQRLFVFLLELKMNHASGYLPQLNSGRLFIEYLFNVMKLHQKCEEVELNFFGLLCFGVKRKSVLKETTRHAAKFNFSDRNGLIVSDYFLEKLDLMELISAAKRWMET